MQQDLTNLHLIIREIEIRNFQIKKYYILIEYIRTLSEIQQRYSTTEREALGLILAIKKFHKYLIIRPFDIIGDHRPLTAIFNTHQNTPNKKLIRWRAEIGPYTFTYIHMAGKDLPLEDYLSRLAIPTDNPFKETDKIKNEKKQVIAMINSIKLASRNIIDKDKINIISNINLSKKKPLLLNQLYIG